MRYDGNKNVCGVVNMPPPMNKTLFQKSSKSIHNVYSETADLSMKQAAREVKEAVFKDYFAEYAVVDICMSLDGTWQERGYASFNGVVTEMSDQGKCIDFEIKFKVCKACQY